MSCPAAGGVRGAPTGPWEDPAEADAGLLAAGFGPQPLKIRAVSQTHPQNTPAQPRAAFAQPKGRDLQKVTTTIKAGTTGPAPMLSSWLGSGSGSSDALSPKGPRPDETSRGPEPGDSRKTFPRTHFRTRAVCPDPPAPLKERASGPVYSPQPTQDSIWNNMLTTRADAAGDAAKKSRRSPHRLSRSSSQPGAQIHLA